MVQKINKLTGIYFSKIGIKQLDTGLSLPAQWNIPGDKTMAKEQQLQVARCNKIIKQAKQADNKYVIHLKQIAKFVVKLSDKLAPTDI